MPRAESKPAQPRKAGRPSKYRPEYVKLVKQFCQLGATDQELCEFFEISPRTLTDWKHAHPEFVDALKTGKEKADERVERSLYHKAIGYKHDAVRIFLAKGKPVYAPYIEHVAPDTVACIFWLKNRRPDKWRDKPEREGEGEDNNAIVIKGGLPEETGGGH